MHRRKYRSAFVLLFCLLGVCLIARMHAATLSESDKFFLAGYEKLRAALADDDLLRANAAAQELTGAGFKVAKSETLNYDRAEFAKISVPAAKVAAGQPGYYIMRCPMLNREWVQTSKEVSNP